MFGCLSRGKENEDDLKQTAYDKYVHLINENKRLEDKYLLK